MTDCLHKNLTLIKERTDKLRCKICHLTITSEELGENYCPECYERTGKKQYDFEKLALKPSNISQYRCEDCNATIKTKG